MYEFNNEVPIYLQIVDLITKEIISEKVDKAVKVALNETNLDNMVYSMVNREIGSSVRSEVSSKVNQAFKTIHVTVECSSDKDKNAVEV